MTKTSKKDKALMEVFNQLLLRAKSWTSCSPTKPDGTSARYIEIKQAMLIFEQVLADNHIKVKNIIITHGK